MLRSSHPMMTAVVLMCVGLSQSSTSPVLTPSVATTFIGGSVRFTCTKYDEDMLIGWNISLLPATFFQDGSSCGINTTLVIDINDVSTNNSLVQCITKYHHNDTSHTSNTGTIIIQDLPMSIYPSSSTPFYSSIYPSLPTNAPTISPSAAFPSMHSPSPTDDLDPTGIIIGLVVVLAIFIPITIILIIIVCCLIYNIWKNKKKQQKIAPESTRRQQIRAERNDRNVRQAAESMRKHRNEAHQEKKHAASFQQKAENNNTPQVPIPPDDKEPQLD